LALIAESEGDVDHVSRVLGHANAANTQSVYAHEFEKVKRADRMRERMEAAYGEMLREQQSVTRRGIRTRCGTA
jgi:integrase